MLDYDGTIAPLRTDRGEAVPLPIVPGLLKRIADHGSTSLAVVSGRPVADLAGRLVGLPARFVGAHGWEWIDEEGSVRRHAMSERAARDLERAEQAAREIGLGDRLEVKYGALVLHTRGMQTTAALEAEKQVRDLWLTRSKDLGPGVALRPISGGVEMRALGHDKGTAVKDLRGREAEGAMPVFIGDDDTDEDAFQQVRAGGLGIRVGDFERPTHAEGRLHDCAGVAAFLVRWITVLEEADTRSAAP
jgi:trehalose 6-phosphate phosphatase